MKNFIGDKTTSEFAGMDTVIVLPAPLLVSPELETDFNNGLLKHCILFYSVKHRTRDFGWYFVASAFRDCAIYASYISNITLDTKTVLFVILLVFIQHMVQYHFDLT